MTTRMNKPTPKTLRMIPSEFELRAAPWDKNQMLRGLLKQFRPQPLLRLSQAAALPPLPAVYALFLEGPLPQYEQFQLGTDPIYIGKDEKSVRARGRWHDDHLAQGIKGISSKNL
jgi:hypothetical protein